MSEGYANRPSRKDDRVEEIEEDRDDRPRKKLGSLAQSARDKKLNEARTLLIVIGVLTLVANIVGLIMEQKEVEKALSGIPAPFREEAGAKVWILLYGIYGSLMALGALFIVFGLIVKQFPVPITIISLLLYVGANIGIAIINPAGAAAGLLIKILIVVGLVRAVQAAFAYEKELANEQFAAEAEPR